MADDIDPVQFGRLLESQAQLVASNLLLSEKLDETGKRVQALDARIVEMESRYRHIREQELLLDINKFALQVSIDIFNARVTLFNAEVSAYNTFAQVYREKIQAESARA